MGKMIRCEVDVSIQKTVIVDFEDDESTCVDDQVDDAVRDFLSLDFDDDIEIHSKKFLGKVPD